MFYPCLELEFLAFSFDGNYKIAKSILKVS